MRPYGGGEPPPCLLKSITDSFGSFETFKNVFMTEAISQFGNGSVWLVQDAAQLKVVKTSNADTPVAWGQDALISCDLWEHSYYLDYLNHRKDYVRNFLNHIVNWDFAAARLRTPSDTANPFTCTSITGKTEAL
jgi:Fe-Mn family superoxide dismutase